MGPLNLAGLILFLFLTFSAQRIAKGPPEWGKKLVRVLLWALLLGNLIRYLLIYPLVYHIIKIPAEFSTVAYFVVPTILLFQKQKQASWAVYSGLMAGFFFYVATVLAGQRIYGTNPLWDTAIAMVCHGILYFCCLLCLLTRRWGKQEPEKLVLGVGYVALRAAVLRPLIVGRERMLIYLLLDAAPVQALFPAEVLPRILPFYYMILTALLYWSAKAFFRENEKLVRRFSVQPAG